MRSVFRLSVVFPVLAWLGPVSAAEPKADPKPSWEEGAVVKCDGLKVILSRPRLVARSKGFLWFPTLHQFDGQHLVAVISNYADEAREVPTALLTRSEDGGLTWSAPEDGAYSECVVPLANGDAVLLPYYLRFQLEALLTGSYQLMRRGDKKWQPVRAGLEVAGWPRKVSSLDAELGGAKPEWQLGSFVFNGQ